MLSEFLIFCRTLPFISLEGLRKSIQRFHGFLPCLFFAHAYIERAEHHLISDFRLEDLVIWILEYIAYIPGKGCRRGPCDISSPQEDPSGYGLQKSFHKLRERCLSRSVLPYDRGGAAVKCEGDAMQDLVSFRIAE